MARIYSSLFLGSISAPWFFVLGFNALAHFSPAFSWTCLSVLSTASAVVWTTLMHETSFERSIRKIPGSPAAIVWSLVYFLALAGVYLSLFVVAAFNVARGIEYWFWILASIICASAIIFVALYCLPKSRVERKIAALRERVGRSGLGRYAEYVFLAVLSVVVVAVAFSYFVSDRLPLY
ncbi:MAG TPA: hypothetical protein VF438_01840 [Candidatus Paceibacterota bacterium]